MGAVSFLTDLSSEMIYPLLPVFLTAVLGAGAIQLGIIEGIAEATASILKIVAGLWTDKIQRRKPFVLFGYSISGLTRPLIGLANIWPAVLIFRFLDRVGKGLRTSPRDALIADVTESGQRGRAYGLHRAMDHAGAVLGPLVAIVLLKWAHFSLRQVFLAAVIPGIFVVILLAWGLKEPSAKTAPGIISGFSFRSLFLMPRDFRLFMGSIFIFTLGNSTDAFFLLRLTDAGVSAAGVAFLWSMHHVVKMISTYWGGHFSDRVGPGKLLLAGWVYYAVIYLLFGIFSSLAMSIAIFLLYGIYFGLTEPTEKALVSHLAPQDLRGTGFGIYHGVIGLGSLPASIVFGLIWKAWGSMAAFSTGAALAALACIFLYFSLGKRFEGAEV